MKTNLNIFPNVASQGKAGDFLDRVTEKAKDMAAEHQLNKTHDE